MDLKELRVYTGSLNVLYVEDDEAIAKKLVSVLQAIFSNVVYTQDGKEGLAAYKNTTFDLIISDISMPNLNGIEMAKEIKRINPKQRLIFSTAHSESHLLMEAIRLNVDGYMLKPIDHLDFMALLEKVSRDIHFEKELHYYQRHLESLVEAKTKELQEANKNIRHTLESTILSLGGVAEARSHETGLHVQRVALYCEFIAEQIGLSKSESNTLRIISPMHDIGKLAIEDSILKKPAKLTDEEYLRMKEHARLGYEMLNTSNLDLFRQAAIVAHEHHEKWDGSGYPRGLRAEEIHIFGRITAFADVFDALISDRVYKKAWPMEKIITLVRQESGKHFDPAICECFLDNIEFFENTNARLQD